MYLQATCESVPSRPRPPDAQIACLLALSQTESITGNLEDASGTTRLEATIYITAWQALAGVAKASASSRLAPRYKQGRAPG